MATRRFMTTAGEQLEGSSNAVTEAVGAATASKAIELTVDLANVKQGNTVPLSKQDVLEALERFYDYIVAVQWPPA